MPSSRNAETVKGPATDEAEAAALHAKWNLSIQPCRVTDRNGKSAGTAVGSRSHIGLSIGAAQLDDIQKLHTGRFQLRKAGCICRGGVHLGSPYLHSGIGIQAKSNLDLLHLMAAALSAVSGPWILGGDWNCTPAELEATGWLGLVGGKIFAPSSSTCGKRTIDFFVVSLNLAHAVRSVHCIGDALFTTHCPVRLLLKARPRTAVMRTLKCPARFGAILPHGPSNLPATTAATTSRGRDDIQTPADLDSACVQLMTDVETELSTLCSHDNATAEKYAGRADGPKFVWRPVCGAPAADLCRTTMVSRAWRRTAGWFRTLNVGTVQRKIVAAKWKILHYKHELPNTTHPGQADDVASFRAWMRLISSEALQSRSWTTAFEQTALQFADRAERAAAKASLAKWRDSLTEGSTCGLGKQHRFTRNALGWTPTQEGEDIQLEAG